MEESMDRQVARRRRDDAASKAFSIPEIRKIIADYVMQPRKVSSFCRLRAVNHAWEETAFDLVKDRDWFRLYLSKSSTQAIKQFLKKVTPNALLPLVLTLRMNNKNFDVKLATRLTRDYSHIVVQLDLYIEGDQGPLSGLDQKLEVFQGRDFCKLKNVNLQVHLSGHPKPYPVHEIQKGLDAIEQITGGLLNLTLFQVKVTCDWPEEAKLVLPSRLTNIYVDGWPSFLLLHPENRFPNLKVLQVNKKTVFPLPQFHRNDVRIHQCQAQWRHFIEQHTKLEKLKILSELPRPLYLPRLKSLKEMHLEGIHLVIETQAGSDVLPHLTTVNLCLWENIEEGELTTLAALLRNVSSFTFTLGGKRPCRNLLPRMDLLCEAFPNVTKLELENYCSWDDLVRPLSRVFLQMTALHGIDISVGRGSQSTDLCCLLTGLREGQISEEEKDTILNGRRDVVTNLRRLKSLLIRTCGEVQRLGPFLFQAVFPQMSELTKLHFISFGASLDRNPFTSVQEMATNVNGKQIRFSFFPDMFAGLHRVKSLRQEAGFWHA